MIGQATALKTCQAELIGQIKEDLKAESKKTKTLKSVVENLLSTPNDVAFLQGGSPSSKGIL